MDLDCRVNTPTTPQPLIPSSDNIIQLNMRMHADLLTERTGYGCDDDDG